MNPPPPAYHIWRNFLYQGTEKVRWAQADLVAPSAPSAPLPLIVSLHGGGWVECDKDMMGWDDALRWVKDGFAFARINYHLAREGIYPAAWHDVGKALAYLAAEAQTFGIDPARIGVIGASAGAHLAALACARLRHPVTWVGPRCPRWRRSVCSLAFLIWWRNNRG